MTGVTTGSVRLNHFRFGPLILVVQGVHCINTGFVIRLIYVMFSAALWLRVLLRNCRFLNNAIFVYLL